jgi:hypothetical protein
MIIIAIMLEGMAVLKPIRIIELRTLIRAVKARLPMQ